MLVQVIMKEASRLLVTKRGCIHSTTSSLARINYEPRQCLVSTGGNWGPYVASSARAYNLGDD